MCQGLHAPAFPTMLFVTQNAVTFQAQGVASRLLTGSADKSAACWQVSCLAGMFAGVRWLREARACCWKLEVMAAAACT